MNLISFGAITIKHLVQNYGGLVGMLAIAVFLINIVCLISKYKGYELKYLNLKYLNIGTFVILCLEGILYYFYADHSAVLDVLPTFATCAVIWSFLVCAQLYFYYRKKN